jgi:hypothetical protein
MTEAGQGKPEKPGFFTSAVAQWDAWRSSYVFKRELLGWPKVRHMGPGHFVMRAPHMGPRRMQQYGGWKPSVATGIVLGFLFAYWRSERGAFVPVFIFMGAIIGFLSIPFWHWMQRTRLKIHFTDGVISWRGPDRRKYAFKPGEWRDLVTVAPHRFADEESRQHRNFMASYPRGQHPEPIFQISSELVMQVGLSGTVFVPVAEFFDDIERGTGGPVAGGDRVRVQGSARRNGRAGEAGMNEGRLLLIAIGAVVLYLLVRDKWNRRNVFDVRTRPPTSHTLQNLIVLAVVVGLGWFFYWVMITRCRGAC